MQHLPISFSHVPVFLPSTPSQVLSLLSPLSLCLSLPPTKLLLASLFSSSPSHLPSLISPPPVPEPGLLPSLPHIKLPLELSLLDPYLPRLVTKEHIPLLTNMSGRRNRSRQRQSSSSRITDEQINDLVSKLQALLPEAGIRSNNSVPATRVLQDTCNYIRTLHREVDDLSERLSGLLATTDTTSAQAAIIRSLLM